MKASILFVTTSSNWPLTDGKRQRTWFLIEALAEKYIVDLLLIGYKSQEQEIEKSNNTINRVFFYDLKNTILPEFGYPSFLISRRKKRQNNIFSQEINKLFSEIVTSNNYSFVFSRYLWPLLLLTLPTKIKIVCDVDDVYFEVQKSKIQKETSFLRKFKLQTLFHLGKGKIETALKRIDIPIIVKESDRSYTGLKEALYLPNIPFGFYIDKKELLVDNVIETTTDKVIFGFIGKLSYEPNYQGLIDFIKFVWNPLMDTKSEARLIIAGSGKIPVLLQTIISTSKNIDLLGFVTYSKQFWSQISVLIVPVAQGGGSNIKVAEALIYGKMVLANPFASRGYEDFINSSYLILPNNNKEWIEKMATIQLPTEFQRKQLSIKAKKTFDLKNWNQVLYKGIN